MKLNFLLARLFQAVVSLMFITMVMFYGTVLLLLPLAVLFYAIKIASLLAPTVVAVLIGIAVLGYLAREVSKMPELLAAVLGVGTDLIALGHKQKERFDPLIAAAQTAKAA